MKKVFLFLGLASLSVLSYAAPTSTFSASAPTSYENGDLIPGDEVLTYKVYCGNTPGGPYPFVYDANNLVLTGQAIDVGTCVQGVPGTYYFVATATSTKFGTESQYSGEATRVYTNAELGRIPLPPTLFSITE